MKVASPSPKGTSAKSDQRLAKAMEELSDVVEHLPDEYGYVLNPGKHLVFTYLKGIVYGLGALTAVAIIIPLLVSMLQKVSWVPLVGDFVKEVGERIEETQKR